MSQEKNKPLSCTRGIHFTKKVGDDHTCMYCGYIDNIQWHYLKDGSRWWSFKPMNQFNDKPKSLSEYPLFITELFKVDDNSKH